MQSTKSVNRHKKRRLSKKDHKAAKLVAPVLQAPGKGNKKLRILAKRASQIAAEQRQLVRASDVNAMVLVEGSGKARK